MAIKIDEMMKKHYFEKAKLITGKKNIHKLISWAHIIEIENFGHLLNGNEVIFTTGLIWRDNPNIAVNFINQLVEHNVSALCVELVVHANEIPAKMKEIAQKHDFPIIIFNEEVRFIDIMMDLHENILGKRLDIWQRLDNFYQELLNAFINNQSVGDLLKILHKQTNKNIVLEYKGEYRFFPSLTRTKRKEIINRIHDSNYYTYPLYLMSKKVGAIYLLHDFTDLNAFEELAIKRFSEVINQFFFKSEEQKEKQALDKNKWLLDVVKRDLSDEHLLSLLKSNINNLAFKDAIIGVKNIPSTLIEKEHYETKFIMNLRSVLESEGLELFVTSDHQERMIILLVINRLNKDIQHTVSKGLVKLKLFKDTELNNTRNYLLSFGTPFNDFSTIKHSFNKALITFSYQKNISNLKEPFYNNLHFYRIFHHFSDKKELKSIIDFYISPLIIYDTKKGTDLLKTLSIYLEELGQKNETAKRLHIVRQTLYYRLSKIEELIGNDYLNKDKRFMIEFALRSINFLK